MGGSGDGDEIDDDDGWGKVGQPGIGNVVLNEKDVPAQARKCFGRGRGAWVNSPLTTVASDVQVEDEMSCNARKR